MSPVMPQPRVVGPAQCVAVHAILEDHQYRPMWERGACSLPGHYQARIQGVGGARPPFIDRIYFYI